MTARPGLLIVPGGQYHVMISTASRPARTAGLLALPLLASLENDTVSVSARRGGRQSDKPLPLLTFPARGQPTREDEVTW